MPIARRKSLPEGKERGAMSGIPLFAGRRPAVEIQREKVARAGSLGPLKGIFALSPEKRLEVEARLTERSVKKGK